MGRIAPLALVACVAALAAPAFAAAASRMPVGFQDDATFRWSPTAPAELDLAAAAHASVVRTIVDWYRIAPGRPEHPADSFDPAYDFNDLDALVRNAAARNIRLLITIWGTPSWANGGRRPSHAPTRLSDLRLFAHAIADRYSGRYPGLPYVGRYSVWNEPNLGIFLSPEFGWKGRIVGPKIYAGLYRAAYAGIKGANPTALVAIGETSNRGRDHPRQGAPVSVAPATFAYLLSQERGLHFDAYAEHPYATRPDLPPTQRVGWPNVTLSMLPRFERSLDTWFHRKVPVWITEYGYQTKPAYRFGVTPLTQARYLSKVLRTLRADPNVHLFVWFGFRDSPTAAWKSGLFTRSGAAKPAYRVFGNLAALIDGDTEQVAAGSPPVMTLPVPRLAYASPAGETVGVTYRVYYRGNVVALGEPQATLDRDGAVRFPLAFEPLAGATYTVTAVANDAHGNETSRTYTLVAPAVKPPVATASATVKRR